MVVWGEELKNLIYILFIIDLKQLPGELGAKTS